jgi:hypothetical protein
MKKLLLIVLFAAVASQESMAQVDINKILNIDDLIGKVLRVKKGYAPKFSAGKIEIPKISKVAELFNVKGSAEAIKLFNTFKTGRTVYRVAAIAGTAVSVYGTVKAMDKAARKQEYQKAIVGGLSTIGAGLLAKFLTKAAAYKAVDVFNGMATKKIKDIFSIQPASSTLGVGLYVNL